MSPTKLVTWFCAASSIASGACSAGGPGVRRYEGPPVATKIAWAKGRVDIVNRNGSVKVDTAGQTADISAIALPFAMAPPAGAGETWATEAMDQLRLELTSDTTGNATVNGSGSESTGL